MELADTAGRLGVSATGCSRVAFDNIRSGPASLEMLYAVDTVSFAAEGTHKGAQCSAPKHFLERRSLCTDLFPQHIVGETTSRCMSDFCHHCERIYIQTACISNFSVRLRFPHFLVVTCGWSRVFGRVSSIGQRSTRLF
eukprot:Lankesteria_metandrocarpae@DN2862_c0_g1_i1.p2